MAPQLTPGWGRILMLTATAFAIEFAYAVEAGYGVPAMLKSGLTEQYASGMWAVGPVLGVLFQSYLGSASDRCKCVWGRRRPFILGIALGACISMGLFPYGKLFGGRHFLHLESSSLRIFGPVFTALTFVAMDFCLDALQTPTRSYLLDSVPVEMSEKAVFLYTTMLGLGSFFGSLISALPWEHFGIGNLTDTNSHVKIVFGVSVIVVAVCVCLTLCSVKERANLPPKSLHDSDTCRHSDFSDSAIESDGSRKLKSEEAESTSASRDEFQGSCLGELHKSILGTVLFAKYMSRPFFWLWFHVFLTWLSLLSMYLFFTNFMGEVVYGGFPNSEDEKVKSLYDKGVRIGCYGLMVMSLVTFVYSLVSKWSADHISLRLQLLGGHMLYFICCGLTVFFPTVVTSMLLSITAGAYFANLNSIPYALIPQYQEAGMLLKRAWPNESDTKGKAVSFLMMAMFAAQFILAVGLGTLVEAIGSSHIVMVVAFLAECLAGVSAFFVTVKLDASSGSSHGVLPHSNKEREPLPVSAKVAQPGTSEREHGLDPLSDHLS